LLTQQNPLQPLLYFSLIFILFYFILFYLFTDLSPDAMPPMGGSLPTPVFPRFASLDFNASNGSASCLRPIDVFICYRRSSGSQLAR
jgi:hypothetical protein